MLFRSILCFAAGLPVPCAGADSPPPLAVKGIEFIRDKSGSEKIAILCNDACVPEWFSLAGENPRVVMDLKGVFLVRPGVRNLKTEGPGVCRAGCGRRDRDVPCKEDGEVERWKQETRG